MEKKSPVLPTGTIPAKPQAQTAPGVSAFRAIAADSRVEPKQYVENFVAPGGGE